MRKILIICITSLLIIFDVIVYISSLGLLSTDYRKPNQNVLGGEGKISLVNGENVQFNLQYFRDNENLYFTYGNKGLYSYSLKTGHVESVCKHIACPHNTLTCQLHDLLRYRDHSESVDHYRYCIADNYLFYSVLNGNSIELWQWEPYSDCRKHIIDYPAYQEIRDERGMKTNLEGVLDKVIRLNKNRIAVCCTNIIYIYDNNFNEIAQFPIGSPEMPFCAVGDYLMWQDYYGYIYCYNLVEDNLLDNVLTNFPYAMRQSFCYNKNYYFVKDNNIYSFSPETNSCILVAKTDAPSPEFRESPLYGSGSHLYYRSKGLVIRRDLDSEKEVTLPDLPLIPEIEIDGMLLIRNPIAEKPTQFFLRYNINGEAVNDET